MVTVKHFSRGVARCGQSARTPASSRAGKSGFASPVPWLQDNLCRRYAVRRQYAADKFTTDERSSAGHTLASNMVGGNGVYTYSTAFPNQTWDNSNYYVDVAFTSTASTPPHLVLSFNPPSPNILPNSPRGTVVTTITPAWSDGTPFTGTLDFGPPHHNDGGTFAISAYKLIINPAGPGVSASGGRELNVTITATQ
jgi:hypothetical protein